jgi:hypothetical protein
MKKQILIISLSFSFTGLTANANNSELYQLPCAAEVAQAALTKASLFISDEDLSCTSVTVNLLVDSAIENRINYKGEREQTLRYVGALSFSQPNRSPSHGIAKTRWQVDFQTQARQTTIMDGVVACHFSRLEYSPAPKIQISAARLKLNQQAQMIPLDRIFESKLASRNPKCTL